MKKFIILLCIVALYSFTKSETETGFSNVCSQLSNEFSEEEHGHTIFDETAKKFLRPNRFAEILTNAGSYDLKEYGKVEKRNSGKIEKTIWTAASSDKTIRLEKITFKTHQQQGITITDYTLFRKAKPKYVHLRLVENDFEEMTIDKTTYRCFCESRLVGADEAIEELDKLAK